MDINGSISRLVIGGLVATGLIAGCGGSGDINISPVTTDSSTDNSVNNSNNVAAPVANPCASNGEIQGDFEAPHCMYSTAFADSGNNITVDMTLVDLDDDGAHVFSGSLFIGEDFTKGDLAAAGITKGGDGPTLTIEAGATVGFVDKTKFMVIMRGSQIQAVGSASAPITITSLSDINGTIASPEAVSEWGGLVINGFAVTNKCTYTGTRGEAGFALDGFCDVASEGSEGQDANHYGGDNDADDSGRLEYFIVKHTGNQVANGDELNGITFSGVGNGTVVKNAQAYSTYDDGFEFFGGSVNMENYVALYVNDDSLDFDEGYNGTVTNALIIQSETNGNRCIEADGIGSYSKKSDEFITDMFTRKLNSRPTVTNITCIYSPVQVDSGTNVSGGAGTGKHDPGAGFRFREGLFPTINNALVVGTWQISEAGSDNWAIRIDDTAASEGFAKGNASINGAVIAAFAKSSKTIAGSNVSDWLVANNDVVFADITDNVAVNPTAASDTGLIVLEGSPAIFGVTTGATPAGDAAYQGGALTTAGTNWTATWAYGLYEGNRGQALWFE